MRGVIEGKISLTLKNNQITLLSERDNKTLDEISLEDDVYRDTEDLAKELLGQAMQLIYELTDTNEEIINAIEEELCNNWGSYEVVGG